MKSFFTLLICFGFALMTNAQNFVNTAPANKNVLLEGIGGINCYYCAEGDATAQNLYTQHTDRFVWINVHAGIFAAPSGNEPDFRSSYADALFNLSGMTTYPAAMVNRLAMPALWQNSGKLAIEQQNWAAAADSILNDTAVVNIAARSEFNISSRQLKVVVQSYYTFMSTTAPNKLFAAILLDSILGPQEGATVYNPSALNSDGNYMHRNVLFDYISNGTGISNPTSGNLRSDTFYYTVPADFNGKSFELYAPKVAVWITGNDSVNVLNAAYSEMTLISDDSDAAELLAVTWDADFNQICGSESSAKIHIQNLGSNAIDSVVVAYNVNSGASSGSFTQQLSAPLAIGRSTVLQLPLIGSLNSNFNTVDFEISTVNAITNPSTTLRSATVNQAELKVSDSTNAVLSVRLDNYPTDISWELIDETDGQTILADSNNVLPNVLISQSFTAENGHCYALKVTDSYGDGLCCGSGQGYYELKIGNLTIIRETEFGFVSGTKFSFQEGVIAVTETSDNFPEATLFPNPAGDFVNVQINASREADLEMSVYNLLGQMKEQRNTTVGQGYNNFTFNTSTYPAGVYLITVRLGDQQKTLKFTVVE